MAFHLFSNLMGHAESKEPEEPNKTPEETIEERIKETSGGDATPQESLEHQKLKQLLRVMKERKERKRKVQEQEKEKGSL